MNKSCIYLQRAESEEMIEAFLFDEVTDKHLALWANGWVPVMKTHRAALPRGETPEDSHWDWKSKAVGWRRQLGYQSFALVCEGELQGLMLVNTITSARLPEQFGKPIVYVEFVATAPWNRPELSVPPKFRGVGRTLILGAIETSAAEGFKGRIGLHSLPKAEGFYEKKCGLSRLGRDSSHQNLAYYELTETQADEFRRNL